MYWIRARAENSHWVLTRRLQFDSKEVLLHTQLSCPKDIASGTGIIPYVYAYINTLRNSIHPMSESIIQANVMLIPVTAAVTSFVRQSRHSITKHTIALLCKHPTESPQLHIIWSIITKYHHISHGDIVNKRWSIVHEKLDTSKQAYSPWGLTRKRLIRGKLLNGQQYFPQVNRVDHRHYVEATSHVICTHI